MARREPSLERFRAMQYSSRVRPIWPALLAACASAPPVTRVPADPPRPPAGLSVTLFSSGSFAAHHADMVRGGEPREVQAPIMGALVEHPKGLLLFDPGPGALFGAGRGEFPFSALAGVLTLNRDPAGDAAARLRSRGLDPARVRFVAFSHLHSDHACAAPDFEGATYLVSDREWLRAQTGPVGQALLGYLRPCVESIAVRGRLRRLHFDGGPYETFAGSFDVFGDGVVRLVPVPGHTPGSMALVVWLPSGAPLVMTGDAAWVEENWRGPEKKGLAGRLEEWDPDEGLWSAQRIKSFAAAWPGAVVVPGHDPDLLGKLKLWPDAYH